jgi:hypothetical protein
MPFLLIVKAREDRKIPGVSKHDYSRRLYNIPAMALSTIHRIMFTLNLYKATKETINHSKANKSY